MSEHRQRPSDIVLDAALEGDLELESLDAEQVKGGVRLYCTPCKHNHYQLDRKCNVYCLHGSAGGGGTYY